MAQQRRMIYAQLSENKHFALLSDRAKITYIFLVVLADDEGRVKGDSEWLRIKVFPYNQDILESDLKKYLKEIVKAKLITLYKINGEHIVQHPNWLKYQYLRSDRKKESILPPINNQCQPNVNQMSDKWEHKEVSNRRKKVKHFSLRKIKSENQPELVSSEGSSISELLKNNKPEFLK